MAMNDDWKNDPKLKEIDKTKLDMLQNLGRKGQWKKRVRHDAIFNECCCFWKKEWTAFFTK